jgi:DNA-binding transcriptional LysR family regulator
MNNIKLLPSLLVFAEVANKQSFTLAANKFGLSKSAVSQQMKRLEQEIGQQLLSRHTRGMSLTAAGEKLLNRCELLQTQVNLAFEEINSNKEMPTGTFAITVPHIFEKNIIIPALKQLCIEFPKIEPDILITDEPRDLIENNLDVSLYVGDLQDSNYRALPIGTATEIFCATPAYVQKFGLLKKPEELIAHKLIATSWQNSPLPIYRNDTLDKKELIKINYIAKSNTLPSVLEMVLHDIGIALLPELVIQSALANGQLVRVLTNYQGWQWPCFFVHRFHGDKPLHIDRFYQLVKHYFVKVNAKT